MNPIVLFVAVNSFVLAVDVIARAERLVGAPCALARFLICRAVVVGRCNWNPVGWINDLSVGRNL